MQKNIAMLAVLALIGLVAVGGASASTASSVQIPGAVNGALTEYNGTVYANATGSAITHVDVLKGTSLNAMSVISAKNYTSVTSVSQKIAQNFTVNGPVFYAIHVKDSGVWYNSTVAEFDVSHYMIAGITSSASAWNVATILVTFALVTIVVFAIGVIGVRKFAKRHLEEHILKILILSFVLGFVATIIGAMYLGGFLNNMVNTVLGWL